MKKIHSMYILTVVAFSLGLRLGGVSMHYADAQGAFGMESVKQMGSALADMQKNVDELQKNMGTLKAAKDQLGVLAADGGKGVLNSIPGMGH
jgi:hypothetical protein